LALPIQILRLDLVMEPFGALISFVIAYYALKAYRLSSERSLLYLYFGFAALGVGMASRFLATFYLLMIFRVRDVFWTGLLEASGLVYGLLRILAYAFFTAAYAGQARKVKGEALPAVLPFIVNPFFDFISVTMLIYITVQSAINFTLTKRADSFLVFIGFLLILFSHVFFMLALIIDDYYFIGHITQLLGLIAMLTMLIKVSKSK